MMVIFILEITRKQLTMYSTRILLELLGKLNLFCKELMLGATRLLEK